MSLRCALLTASLHALNTDGSYTLCLHVGPIRLLSWRFYTLAFVFGLVQPFDDTTTLLPSKSRMPPGATNQCFTRALA